MARDEGYQLGEIVEDTQIHRKRWCMQRATDA